MWFSYSTEKEVVIKSIKLRVFKLVVQLLLTVYLAWVISVQQGYQKIVPGFGFTQCTVNGNAYGIKVSESGNSSIIVFDGVNMGMKIVSKCLLLFFLSVLEPHRRLTCFPNPYCVRPFCYTVMMAILACGTWCRQYFRLRSMMPSLLQLATCWPLISQEASVLALLTIARIVITCVFPVIVSDTLTDLTQSTIDWLCLFLPLPSSLSLSLSLSAQFGDWKPAAVLTTTIACSMPGVQLRTRRQTRPSSCTTSTTSLWRSAPTPTGTVVATRCKWRSRFPSLRFVVALTTIADDCHFVDRQLATMSTTKTLLATISFAWRKTYWRGLCSCSL